VIIKINRITSALGAEVSGVDLRQPVTDEDFDAIHKALLEYQVIFFREQHITPGQQLALAKRFGPIQTHPAYAHVEGYPEVCILENSKENPSKIDTWHTDMTFRPNPPLGSMLHAQQVPEFGGDTMWSSMSASFEGLSDKWQHFLDGLEAIHSFEYGFQESLSEPGGRQRLAKAVEDNPPVAHPVIRIHPESGKKGIFVNALFTIHIVGMKQSESKAVLEFLNQHITLPEFTCRFKWQKYSIAFWDNRITQHVPVNDIGLQYRLMHRVTIDGDQPL